MHWWKSVFEKWYRSGRRCGRVLFLMACGLLPFVTFSQNTSVLSTGSWYKIAVSQSGVYKIDADLLRKMGINITGLNPKNLRLYGNGGKMLPQSNTISRPSDLIENAVWVPGEDDNRFDETDALYFYAEGPQVVFYDSLQKSFSHQINTYSDSSYYYLTIGTDPGLRINSTPSLTRTTHTTDQFDSYWFHEEESINLLQSGRAWWGEYLGVSGQLRLQAELPGIIPNSTALLRGAAIASAQVTTGMRWRVNDQEVGEQLQGVVSTYRYDLKAQRSEKNYNFNFGATPPSTVAVNIEFNKNGQSNAQAYLDYVALQVKRQLRAYSSQLPYRFLPSEKASITYLFQDVPQDWHWWDIADPQRPTRALLSRNADGTAEYSANDGKKARTYVGFTPAQAFVPARWERVANQNLRGLTVPNLVIITPKAWLSEALRLADHRQNFDNISSVVVTTEQVFHEFSSGQPDPTAIRDFVRSLYRQNPDQLRYLLLFGDATYDYKNRGKKQSTQQQQRWVPVYQSRESLHPVFTYSSDDYYGFLDPDEGEWVESRSGDHLLDIGIGRIPAKTPEEARIVVDKLIHYSSSPQALGSWRNRISFVADDGDGNIHQQHADLLAQQVQHQFLTQRLFVDAFPRVTSPEGFKSPELNTSIRQKINEGTLILNYTGHGGASGWAEEQILTLGDMQTVRGYNNLPLLLTATCEFGRYDDPALVSGAELMVLSPRGAAIGALTTTRPVFSSTNFSLNTAFYDALATSKPGTRLGDLIKNTKNNSLSGSLNRNFALLGDPSMRLARAEYEIKWESGTDTLSAQKKVTLRGSIHAQAESGVASSFNGKAFISVYDKPVRFQTNGQTGKPEEYSELRAKLYEGQVSVKNGRFACTFVVPRNIDYRTGPGRVSAYAIRSDSLADAAGQLDVWVGGASQVAPDRTPPRITAYLNDSTFQNGQTIPANSVLWIRAFDESGISISSAGLGQNLTATLNDSVTYILNEYFRSQLDDYRSGLVRFPLDQLPPGSYQLIIKVWDTNTNSSEISLHFVVKAESGIQMTASVLFPNPFQRELSFKLAHTRPLEDVELSIQILSLSGQIIHKFKKVYYNSDSIISESIEFGNNSPVVASQIATYLYQIQIRSINDNTKDIRTGKLLHVP